jgi:hypothetical protein
LASVEMAEVESDLYLLGGNQLYLAGRWQIDVVVRRQGVEDSTARFEWIVPQSSTPQPIIISDQPWEPLLTLVAGTAVLWRINRPY